MTSHTPLITAGSIGAQEMVRRGSDDLVAAARVGDEEAWRQLYLLNARRLSVWLQTLASSDSMSSAEDTAAEAWLTAASKIAEFQGSDDDFAAWLFTIARNHAANSRRKASRRATDPVDVQTSRTDLFGTVVEGHGDLDNQAETRALLAHLTPREAQVVACIDVVGLDVAGTAKALGMKPTAVRVARHRALGRLRKVLLEDNSATAEGMSRSTNSLSAPVA